MMSFRISGARLEQAHVLSAVGAKSVANPEQENGTQSARVEEAREINKMIRWAKFPWNIKADLLATLAVPRGVYACSVASVSKRQLADWRYKALMALLGAHWGRHCAEIVHTLLSLGHRSDPAQALIYQSLATLHGILASRVDLYATFCSAWAILGQRNSSRVPSPVGHIKETFKAVGWKRPEPFVFITSAGQAVNVKDVDRGEWEHIVGDELRSKAWRRASERWVDMQGIEVGVQREITLSLLEHGFLTAHERARLRAILAGGVWSQDRLYRARLADSPICPYCHTGEVEDQERMWWKCPAWKHIRQRSAKVSTLKTPDLPVCFRQCAIATKGMEGDSNRQFQMEARNQVAS